MRKMFWMLMGAALTSGCYESGGRVTEEDPCSDLCAFEAFCAGDDPTYAGDGACLQVCDAADETDLECPIACYESEASFDDVASCVDYATCVTACWDPPVDEQTCADYCTVEAACHADDGGYNGYNACISGCTQNALATDPSIVVCLDNCVGDGVSTDDTASCVALDACASACW